MQATPPDWIVWTNRMGGQQVTYDSSVQTAEQAEKKGYSNVEKVFENGTGRVKSTGEVFNFKADGSFSVNGGKSMDIDDTSYAPMARMFFQRDSAELHSVPRNKTPDGVDVLNATIARIYKPMARMFST